MKTLKIILLTLLCVWAYSHPNDTRTFVDRVGKVVYGAINGADAALSKKDSGVKVMTRDEDPFPLLPDLPPVHEPYEEKDL